MTLLEMIGRLLGGRRASEPAEPAAGPRRTGPPPVSNGPPPIDRDALLARCMGNLEFAQSLLSDFEGDLPERVEQIARACPTSATPSAAAESAHALKGAAGMVTAESLQALAAEIEAAGKTGDLADVGRIWPSGFATRPAAVCVSFQNSESR